MRMFARENKPWYKPEYWDRVMFNDVHGHSQLAPDPTFGPTRRQLLEYQLVFEVDGVLVVDADRRTISRVAFDADRIGEDVTAPG